MNDEKPESALEKIKDALNNAVGLPPGKFPNGETKPTDDSDTPRGTLTSEDTDEVPSPHGTGIAPIA